MDHDETGCQAPDRPILCVNNCGFFGQATTRNMCSKCHRETVLKEEQDRLAVSSFDNIVNGTSSKSKEAVVALAVPSVDVKSGEVEPKVVNAQVSDNSSLGQPSDGKKAGPTRCLACRKRVGLIGFTCRCGNLFCATHRYSDKHNCPFDYQAAGQSAIAKANLVVKAEKLDKI